MKKILNPHRKPQMILPIEAPRITEPKTNKKTLPLKAKKKVSLTVHVRFLSINLQYLIFTFWGFYPYEKKCKVYCMCFFYTCHHEVKVVILHPFFLQRFCQQIMYHLVCPLSCSFCKKYWQILHTITVKSNC